MKDHGSDRMMLGMVAACCAGPMLLILFFSLVVGVSIGPAAALALGVTAAVGCVAFMVARHRGQQQ